MRADAPRPNRPSPIPKRLAAAGALVLLAAGWGLLAAGRPAAADRLAGGWSDDPARNLALADGPGDQVQPKLVPDGAGGVYLSWYDGGAGGYDPSLQRIDARGFERWPHAGLKVADTGFDWVTDYGLSVDREGAALLAFRDDRGEAPRVTLARILPDGSLAWGPEGRSPSGPAEFIGPPKVLGSSDGAIYLAWNEDARLRLLRLNPDGEPVWRGPLTLEDRAGAALYLADLQAAPDGGCILSWVRNDGFTAPRHLYAQRYDVTGRPSWGERLEGGDPEPLAIFTAGSLQFGNFPSFLPDGQGGAVFAWYETSPLQVRVQRVRPDGSRVFAEDGALAGSPRPDLERVEPALAYDPASADLYVFWRETPVAGGVFRQALRGQRFDAQGVPRWGEDGREIVAMGPTERVQLQAFAEPDGVTLADVETLAQAQDQRLWIRRLDRAGDERWPASPVAVSSVASTKSRLALLGSPAPADAAGADERPWALLAWEDGRAGQADIYAQSVQPDGRLGPAEGPTPEPGSPTPEPTREPGTPVPVAGRIWLPRLWR